MIFAELSVNDALGTMLAHSVTLPEGKFNKGRLLSQEDIERMIKANLETIKVVRFEKNDISENDAAQIIARASSGDGTDCQEPFTGRCNIYAQETGLLVLNSMQINALNSVDEAVTIATLPNFEMVEKGRMLATVKIIPFAAPKKIISVTKNIATQNHPIIKVVPFHPHTVGLIMTRLKNTKDSILDKTKLVLSQRLARYGSRITEELRCHHDNQEISRSITELLNLGCDLILIFGATAITDRKDEIPRGIELAGGQIERFGMPVDPGNLLLTARHASSPIIGLPGCARSPKLNGFDWVLERLLAKVAISNKEISQMGIGGLLKEIPSRPQPRQQKRSAGQRYKPKITAIILAAGQSRRMGAKNKLLAELEDTPMISWVVRAACESQVINTIVVTGHQKEKIGSALEGFDISITFNPNFEEGLSSSLKTGLDLVPKNHDGALVLLGDMPFVKSHHINRLIAAFDPSENRTICIPTYKGRTGNPVLFGHTHFIPVREIEGDIGLKAILAGYQEQITEVPMQEDGICTDIDTNYELAKIRQSLASI